MPEKVRLLHGEKDKRRHRIEPQPLEERPEPADYLTAEARAVWNRLTPQLDGMGILYAADADELAGLCSAVALFQQAERALTAEGYIVEDDDGNRRRNPWTFIRTQSLTDLHRLGSAFGLNPAARAHLAVRDKPDESTDSKLMAG